jgi:hemoglobin-like flavoprotein
MTPQQIQLIRQSFALVAPIADTAAALFYQRLFELDPALRPMFPPSLDAQGKKLMQMIGAAVGQLDKPQVLIPVLQNLGRRHVGYGVEDRHYDTVGESLLWTLEQGLGAAFTPDVRSAWTELYGVIATTMKNAAAGASPAKQQALEIA